MPQLTTDHIDLRRDELLMVFWHRKSKRWWATVSRIDSDMIRAKGDGETPTDALAELFLAVGAGRVTNLQ